MRDISHDLMHEVGVDAPYFGYADIKVNVNVLPCMSCISYEQRVLHRECL